MKKSLLLSFCTLLTSATLLFSQEEDQKRYLLPSNQIMSMMESSQLVYEPHIEDDYNNQEKANFPTLHDQLYLKIKDNTITLLQFNLTDVGKKYYDLAEEAYSAKEYDKAIGLYRKVLDTDPEYHKIYTMIGDQYYMMQNYDSAKYFFKLAIEKNFVDYSAHWFLADTYAKTSELDEAVKQITIGHLLNRNHKNLYDRLKTLRKAVDKNWKEWEIAPQCSTYMEDDKVVIMTTKDWLGYACAEALWKFEPGFAEGVCGKKYDGDNAMVEKEYGCLYANLNSHISDEMMNVIKDGYFQEMVWYERISKHAPSAMLLISDDFFKRIVEYVDRFH